MSLTAGEWPDPKETAGAFYYYHTEPNKDYEQTILDVKSYATQQNIPYRHILLDSWWYFKGTGGTIRCRRCCRPRCLAASLPSLRHCLVVSQEELLTVVTGDGVKEWLPMPSIFPHGMQVKTHVYLRAAPQRVHGSTCSTTPSGPSLGTTVTGLRTPSMPSR